MTNLINKLCNNYDIKMMTLISIFNLIFSTLIIAKNYIMFMCIYICV